MPTYENKKFIVCYLDILGYKDLIEKNYENIQNINSIERSFSRILNQIKRDKEILPEWHKNISLKIISDTILITMPFDNNLKISMRDVDGKIFEYTGGKALIESTIAFINVIAQIIANLASNDENSFFVRGGITIEHHYESVKTIDPKKDGSIFIFSKAYIESYYLAEKIAKYIRVIISDNFIKNFEEVQGENTIGGKIINKWLSDGGIMYDREGIRCLGIYSFIKDAMTYFESTLKSVSNSLLKKINENRMNPDILKKYIYFLEYHNNFIREKATDYKNYIVNYE